MTHTAPPTALLAPDPLLPLRDELLDDTVVGHTLLRLLRSADGSAPWSCTRVRARYRRGESLRVTFRVRDGSGPRLVSARMFSAGRAPAKFAQARAVQNDRGAPPRSVLFDESLRTVFWLFPADRKLWGLDRLMTPPACVSAAFDDPWVRSELVAYTPEKAATARCRSAAGVPVGYAKMQLGDETWRSVKTLDAVRRGLPTCGPLHLPRAVGELRDPPMALYSPAPGSPLHQLRGGAVPAAMGMLGTALRLLHDHPPAPFPPFTRSSPDSIVAAGDLVAGARPDLAPLCTRLVEALLPTRPGPSTLALLHGDLHPKNVLVHDDGVSLVDLDQASVGPPAAELGATLARLWCLRPESGLTPDTGAAAAEELLAGYGLAMDRSALIWYAAAALLVERAARAVSRIDLANLADLERVLTTAVHWAESGEEDPR